MVVVSSMGVVEWSGVVEWRGLADLLLVAWFWGLRGCKPFTYICNTNTLYVHNLKTVEPLSNGHILRPICILASLSITVDPQYGTNACLD